VRKLKTIAVPALVSVLATGFAHMAGFRINTASSLPKGIYKITEKSSCCEKGDLILFCLPDAATEKAKKRGYVKGGFCKGGLWPLMKTVKGVSGDKIEIKNGNININGAPLGKVLEKDSRGREMKRLKNFTLSENEFFAISHHPKSWDSRYFGPIHRKSIIGKMKRVWTWKN